MREITTTDLSKFGNRERLELQELLNAWNTQGLPDDFYPTSVKPMWNMYSGNVFLTNDDFQVAMLNDDKLESFYTCPGCGNEGFLEDISNKEYNSDCCREYVKEITGQ